MISFRFTQITEVINLQTLSMKIAEEIGFSRIESTKVAIAVSELATNCVKYAGGGKLSFECRKDSLAITVEDDGPGIKDLEMAFTDHFSDTKYLLDDDFNEHNGLGTGLPAVERLMDVCNVEKSGKEGTKIRIEKHLERTSTAPSETREAIDARIQANWAKMLTGN